MSGDLSYLRDIVADSHVLLPSYHGSSVLPRQKAPVEDQGGYSAIGAQSDKCRQSRDDPADAQENDLLTHREAPARRGDDGETEEGECRACA